MRMRTVLASLFMITATAASAQSLPAEGNLEVTYTATNTNVLKPMNIGDGKDFVVLNQSMTAVNTAGNAVLNNMGGRCQFTRMSDLSTKGYEVRGWCTYADKDGDEIYERCEFLPGSPKCTLTGGTGTFQGIQADLQITSTPLKPGFDNITQAIGTKKGSYKIAKPI
jgi:hypothetical protein